MTTPLRDHASATYLNLTFYTVSTTTNLTNTTTDADNKNAFDNLADSLNQVAQPVVLGAPKGSGPYTVAFATEHGVTASLIQNTVSAAGFANATVTAGL